MSDSYTPGNSRRFRPSNPWLPYVGDCKAVNNYLRTKTDPGWLVPKFLNAFFRGFSQVVLANNPFAGLIILLALLWADPMVGLAAAVTATTALITALALRQEYSSINAGLPTYNAVLVGTVTISLWTPTFGEPVPAKVWVCMILGAAFSVFVTSALANILSSFKLALPCLTLPFNIVALLLFTCLMPPLGNPETRTALDDHAGAHHTGLNDTEMIRHVREVSSDDVTELPLNDESGADGVVTEPSFISDLNVNNDSTVDPFDDDEDERDPNELDWGSILSGIMLSMGQVFAINDLFASILIYVAVMLYSPVMCLVSLTGAVVATITGIMFTSAPYTAVYTGLWGYNGILSAAAVGGFFIAMTCHSFWTAIANVLFTVFIQQALMVAFHSLRLPVFTLPFCLSTLIFLSVSTAGDQLPRVTEFSFPEYHRYQFLQSQRLSKLNKTIENDVVHPEEKELVLKDIKVISEEVVDIEKGPLDVEKIST